MRRTRRLRDSGDAEARDLRSLLVAGSGGLQTSQRPGSAHGEEFKEFEEFEEFKEFEEFEEFEEFDGRGDCQNEFLGGWTVKGWTSERPRLQFTSPDSYDIREMRAALGYQLSAISCQQS